MLDKNISKKEISVKIRYKESLIEKKVVFFKYLI